MRFRLATLLLLVAVVAVGCSLLLPPTIQFGEPAFTAKMMQSGEWLLKVSIPVKNTSKFHVRFRAQNTWAGEPWAVGAVKKPGEDVRKSNTQYALWKNLPPGESTVLKEFYIEPQDEIGIQLLDWMGREHVVFHPNLKITEAWERRSELPADH